LNSISCKNLSSYDLKKRFTDSPVLYWSGNNNQIYKTLLELLNEGLVTNEILYQENSPNKKLYSITEKGKVALKEWMLSTSEAYFNLSEGIKATDINIHKEQLKRGLEAPNRTTRERLLWDMIYQNIISTCENELVWSERLELNPPPPLKRGGDSFL